MRCKTPIHRPRDAHAVDMSFGLTGWKTYRDVLDSRMRLSTTNNGTFEESITLRDTIQFQVNPMAIKSMLNGVDDKRFSSPTSYHIMPSCIHVTSIDSSLKGPWEACLVSSLPKRIRFDKDELRLSAHQMYTPSVFTTLQHNVLGVNNNPTSASFRQWTPVRESPPGGNKDHRMMHTVRGDSYQHADFGRWINVDFDKLVIDINAQGGSEASRRATEEFNGRTSGSYGVVQMLAIEIPATFAEFYLKNELDAQFIALNEHVTLSDIEATLVAAGTTAPVKLQSVIWAQPYVKPLPGALALPYDNFTWNLKTYVLVSWRSMLAFVSKKRVDFNRDHHMMRLDEVTLHIRPIGGDWSEIEAHANYMNQKHGFMTATREAIEEARALDVGKDPSLPKTVPFREKRVSYEEENRARFTFDMSILYEPLTDYVPTSEENNAALGTTTIPKQWQMTSGAMNARSMADAYA